VCVCVCVCLYILLFLGLNENIFILMFCWRCIVVYKYSKTNEIHFVYSVNYELTASTCFKHYLLIFRMCLTNGSWYIAAPGMEFHCNPGQPTDTTRTQYTKCCSFSASWRWESNARNMWRPLIHNKLNTQSAPRCSYYIYFYFNIHWLECWWHGRKWREGGGDNILWGVMCIVFQNILSLLRMFAIY
jgi:hypothetical protein